MIIYAIKSKSKNNDTLIFHALPNKVTKFQWYISENINEKGSPIDGQIYECYVLSTDTIKEKNYCGKYLYCSYLETESKHYQNTEYIQLGLSIDNMIENGTFFNDVSEFDEQGNIIDCLNKKTVNNS